MTVDFEKLARDPQVWRVADAIHKLENAGMPLIDGIGASERAYGRQEARQVRCTYLRRGAEMILARTAMDDLGGRAVDVMLANWRHEEEVVE